jgi:hypothetical protein
MHHVKTGLLPRADSPAAVSYAVKFYAYIFVANILAFVIVVRWLHTHKQFFA